MTIHNFLFLSHLRKGDRTLSGQLISKEVDMARNTLNIENIGIGLDTVDKETAIKTVVHLACRNRVAAPEKILHALLLREQKKESTVGVESAMPHSLARDTSEILMGIGVFNDGIEWDDKGKKIRIVVVIASPSIDVDKYVKNVVTFGKHLNKEQFVQSVIYCKTIYEVYEKISKVIQ